MHGPCLPPMRASKRPRVPTPARACDAHFHVFGPVRRVPHSAERTCTPPETLLDALAREPKRLRAVALVKETASCAQLRRLAEAGVRALRFHHQPCQPGRFSSLGFEAFEKLAPLRVELGLHAHFFMDARALHETIPAENPARGFGFEPPRDPRERRL